VALVEVVNAILYVLENGCDVAGCRETPPWGTVYWYFTDGNPMARGNRVSAMPEREQPGGGPKKSLA
jgi:hypothetical protein